jgi:hypothetical protein
MEEGAIAAAVQFTSTHVSRHHHCEHLQTTLPLPLQVLDIASMTLFLMAMDCQYFAVPENMVGHNQEFPDECEFGHMSHNVAEVSRE